MDDSNYEVKKDKHPSGRLLMAILAAGLLIGLGLALGLGLGLRSMKSEPQEAKEVPTTTQAPLLFPKAKYGTYRFAAVASDIDVCSEIGRNIMAVNQGSAVDASIATLFCIGVVNRHNSGIGGGFFMTIFNSSSGSASVLDARETAPIAATESFYLGKAKDASTFGGLAIGVPGDVMGHWEAHQKYGRVPWKDLLAPSIKLCKEGVTVQPYLQSEIEKKKDVLKNMTHDMYFHPDTGEVVKVGDTVKYPKLAATLEAISQEGAHAYYNGSLTDAIVADIQDHGGVITREDLNQYTATWRTPVSLTLRDNLVVHSMPPPGSGAVLEFILNILDGYNMNADSLSDNGVLTYHRMVEAMKFAFAKRSNLGDEDFANVTELVKNMTSRDFADSIREQITDDRTHDTDYYGPTFYTKPDAGTSQVSVIDAQGNAVSITSTINTIFGSKVVGSRTGILFNNEMDDFSTPGTINSYGVPASAANFIQAGKRPLSSMCPAIVVNATSGNVVLVIGGSGGTKITTAAGLVAMYTLRMGMSLPDAIDRRRVHHQLLPKTLAIEENFPQEIIDGLKLKGHEIKMVPPRANVNAVLVNGDEIDAVSDSRKGGTPAGY